MLSHASAAAAWELRRSGAGAIDVTVGPGGRARHPGLRLHRSGRLHPDEIAHVEGLPVTTPARTLLDLAAGGLPVDVLLDHTWHRSPAALTADRARDRGLVVAGHRVLRFTWSDVTRRPRAVAHTVARVLATRSDR